MLNKIKTKLAGLAMLLILALPMFMPVAANAADPVCPDGTSGATATCPTIQNSLCNGGGSLGVNNTETGSCAAINTGNSGETRVNKLIKTVINVFSVIVGVVAVIMIIVGGFRYITSAGAAEKIKSARNTILYALIGLVIVALAQVVVKYVLTKAVA